jgi:hypothetical protein
MRRIMAVGVWLIAASAFAQSSFRTYGFLTLREIRVKAQPSWSTGGWGRFDVGAPKADDHRTVNVDVLQLGIDWTPASWFLVHTDGLARREQSGTVGRRAGFVQAYADLRTERLRLRGGAFFLPTSLENVDPLWNSRYTITYSALNSWMGQEVRPMGADIQFSPNFYFTIGGTAFRGNDTMGSALASRGWTIGNRISLYDEVIARAPAPGRTRPIGPEVDKRIGDSERIRIQLPERALLQFTRIDNRAKLLVRPAPETPWRTKFNIIGAQLGTTGPTTLAAEWAYGSTALGFPGGSLTMDFDTVYVLLSQKRGSSRFTGRIERFTTKNHKRPVNDSKREHGSALTLSWLNESSTSFRSGLEYVHVKGDRLAAPDPRTGGSTITLELRYRF